ncbi:DDE_Tnp_IS1595 domain-containing protein [Trichonephila clavipes]|nr:DDE_Tnp_IS1595 domain-containing protein [Trichonephila clavipes]
MKYGKGRRVNGKWVFGGVQRESNKCFFRVVESRTKEELLKVIHEWILPGTTIISDCWKAYDCLSDEGVCSFKSQPQSDFLWIPTPVRIPTPLKAPGLRLKRAFIKHMSRASLILTLQNTCGEDLTVTSWWMKIFTNSLHPSQECIHQQIMTKCKRKVSAFNIF